MMLVFFFFQAEDGIRDLYVTGVQTCALPIWKARRRGDRAATAPLPPGGPAARSARRRSIRRRARGSAWPAGAGHGRGRSEERRVGKECRSRGAPEHEKKNGGVKSRRGNSRAT